MWELINNWSGLVGIFLSAGTLAATLVTKKAVNEKLKEYKLRRNGAEGVRVLKGALKSMRDDSLCNASILWGVYDVVSESSKQDNEVAGKYKNQFKELEALIIQDIRLLRKGESVDEIELCRQIYDIIVLLEKEIYK